MSQDSDKSFEPTQKKLDDARKKGEFARSADLTLAAAYGGWLIAAMATGAFALTSLGAVLSGILGNTDYYSSVVFGDQSGWFLFDLIVAIGAPIAGFFFLPAVAAILATIGQNAFVFSIEKIKPKWTKISILKNAQNKFGRSGLFEFAKSATKLVIYCVVLGVYLSFGINQIVGSVGVAAGQLTMAMGKLIVGLMGVIVVLALMIGGFDYLWQIAEHRRKNMMSRQDIKDETKQSEGDPHAKQQRRQKGIEIAMNKMLTDAETADVVIVNPTHFAVALKWNASSATSPVLVAKGVDEIAAKIRGVANKNGIPIRSDPPTARAIHSAVELGQVIRPEHYRAVAAAIRFADAIKRKVRHVEP